jgi:hypothetical protein
MSAFTQNSINTSGENVSNNFGSISYSVGQLLTQTVNNRVGSISHGVQQTFLVSTLNIEDNKNNISVICFPNPVQNKLCLSINNYNHGKLIFKLLNNEGKIIQEGDINGVETMVSFQHLPSSVYFVEILNDNINLQTFQIIKN